MLFIFHKWNDYENILPFATKSAAAGLITVAVSRAPLNTGNHLANGVEFPGARDIDFSSIVYELKIRSRGLKKIFWTLLHFYSFVCRFFGIGLNRVNSALQRFLTKGFAEDFNRLLISFEWIIADHQLRRGIFPYDSIMKAASTGSCKLALMPHGVHLIDDEASGVYRRAYDNLQNTFSHLKCHFTRHPEAQRRIRDGERVIFTYPIRYSRDYFEQYLRVNNWVRNPLPSLRSVLICEHDYSRFKFEASDYDRLIAGLIAKGYIVTIKSHTRSNRKLAKYCNLYSTDNTTKLMLDAAIIIIPWGTVFFDAALLGRPIIWVPYLRRKPFQFYPEIEGVGFSTTSADNTISNIRQTITNYDSAVALQDKAFDAFVHKYLNDGSNFIDAVAGEYNPYDRIH